MGDKKSQVKDRWWAKIYLQKQVTEWASKQESHLGLINQAKARGSQGLHPFEYPAYKVVDGDKRHEGARMAKANDDASQQKKPSIVISIRITNMTLKNAYS